MANTTVSTHSLQSENITEGISVCLTMEFNRNTSNDIAQNNLVQPQSMFSNDGKKHRYVNTPTLDSSVYDNIVDYETLNKNNSRDEHVYRGLSAQPEQAVDLPEKAQSPRKKTDVSRAPGTRNDIQLPDKTTTSREQDNVVKASGRRILYAIIAILVLLLVAATVSFTVLYVKSKSDSSTAEDLSSSNEDSTTVETTTTTMATTTTTTTTTTGTSAPLSITERCQTYDGLILHPDECQAYYNCSHYVPPHLLIYNNNERYWMECPYPQLFSAETMSCEHFERVTCGNRTEAKDECDYRAINCVQCVYCGRRGPDCLGKEDGVHERRGWLWTPTYVICYKERIVSVNMECPYDTALELRQLFSPEYRSCVTLDRIPPEHGGMAPNCTGKPDGYHPNEYDKCNLYTECKWEHHIKTFRCNEGYFDEVTKRCTSSPTSLCICDGWGC